MARNGSGTYSRVNTFTAGNTITASGHNQNWADLETEMTNSLALDGQSTMTGALKAASGTVALPGIAFGSDTDSGLYRIGANNIGVAANGAKVLDIATTGLTVTGDVDATTVKQGTFALVPAGVIWSYGGAAAPDGFLLCDGTSYLRTTHPALFTAIGTTYGAADGTHFNVPDMGGRAPVGKESVATRLTTAGGGVDGATLGAVGGAQNGTILQANLPVATLTTTITDPGHTHNYSRGTLGGGGGASGQVLDSNTTVATVSATTGITASTALGGSGTAFKLVQPTIVLNYIIKT